MIQGRYVCRGSKSNNGIRQVHLVLDDYASRESQPEELLINTKSWMFVEGDEYFVHITNIVKRHRELFPPTK